MLFAPIFAYAQIDPVQRDLIQLGYNEALEGHAPFAGYAFYYHNQPDFLRTNLTCGWRSRRCISIPSSALSTVWGRTRTSPSAWRAAVMRTVTTKFAAAHFSRGIVQRALRRNFSKRLSFVQSRRFDSVEFNSARHGALFHFCPHRQHIARVPTAGGSRRVQRAHRFALGRHRTDVVSGARDGIVRLV